MTLNNIFLTGTIKNLQNHKNKAGETMAFACFESENRDIIDVIFFADAWKGYEAKIKDGKLVTLCGKFSDNVQNSKAGKNGLAVSYVLPRVKKTEETLKTNWDIIKNPQKYEKKMNFKIHRGTNEIGGTCVEVWTDETRVIVDMGTPLVNADGTPFDEKLMENKSREELIKMKILPDIPDLYRESKNIALLISHAHKDHYGLMEHIHPSCPVYMGNAADHLIKFTNNFLGKVTPNFNIKHFKHYTPFKIGDIEITPYLMDHSAFDAYALLMKANGKSILYSGDFRNHGKKYKIFDFFCNNIQKGIDYLLLEGSTMDKAIDKFPTEEDLEKKFIDTFEKTKGIKLVFVSGQNIDRLVTLYNACVKAKKILLVDFYTANVMKTINKKASSIIPFPSRENFNEINVYFPYYLTKKIEERGKYNEFIKPFEFHKKDIDKLDDIAEKTVMVVRPHVIYDLNEGLKNYSDGCFIFSMWKGYKKDRKNKKMLDFISRKGMPIIDHLHTSGHADLHCLRRMVEAVKPEHIVPIHTFKKENYPQLFPGENVKILNDGVTITF